MTIYISGKITGNPNYKAEFKAAEDYLQSLGYKTINPAAFGLDDKGFTWAQCMTICKAYLRCCDSIYMLDNWLDSKGADRERTWATAWNKKIYYQGESEPPRVRL